MILISPTRTLPSPRPIDTDPILNYRHIQPAAAAAAVGPWLGQNQHHHHHHDTLAKSPNITTAPATHSPSELSASPAPSAVSTGSSLLDPQSVPHIKIPHSSSPPAIMLPQPSSDDDSSTAEEEQPSAQSSNATLNTPTPHTNAPHQLDSHASSVGLYDLPPTSSSAPTTSSSSSPFPSNVPSHQQPSPYSSSPHPNQEHHPHHPHHGNQFYQQSPPALHSPLQSAHHPQQSFDARPHSSLFAHQHYHSRPQSAPHSTSQFSLDPHVLAAAAANVEVKKWDEENTYYYQVAHKGVTVGRLKGSGLVNGTKLLNLAGISRGKRDGILKNEKIRKVVKHGTMHLKGVWIAFDRAVFLAEQHSIADKIFPLLVVNLEHYVPIEPPLMAGGTKLGPGSLFHHHHPRHPRLLPQPIKFPPSTISLAPASANSFSSTGGWPSGPSSALPSIGYNEPFSAPPIPRSAATADTSPSIYEQAQFQYLNSAQANNPDLLERRHTLPNNSFHGYNSVPSFGSSQPPPPVSYSFHYNSTHVPGYPPRSSTAESATPNQFEYQSKNHNGNGNGDAAGSYPATLYHSQPAARPVSSTTAQPSPALNSAPLLLGDLSPGSSTQIVDHGAGDFRLSTGTSNGQVKQEGDDESCNEKRLIMDWNPSC
ncbi:hypothetical protein PGT21_012591 [Puccinia graminis f. sp. tritici]|uniref:HTH APSES-type domain-containing protein n=1 Tax=Puccinia graminis f. sp. tritici TaxID=56615 RepID=A0A5B0QMN0_PUCGR|nr:hypothetical protein PGT21_012591 [Puccinia graminis f. sp. tritici]